MRYLLIREFLSAELGGDRSLFLEGKHISGEFHSFIVDTGLGLLF